MGYHYTYSVLLSTDLTSRSALNLHGFTLTHSHISSHLSLQTLREAIVSPASSPRNAQSPRNTQSPRSPTSLSFFPKSTEALPTPQLSLQMLSNNIRYSIPITLPLPSLCKPAVQTRIAKALAAAMREEATGKHSGNTNRKPKRTRPVVNEASAAAAGGGASPLFGGASPLLGGSRRAAGAFHSIITYEQL